MIKHDTGSAFVFHRDPAAGWRVGLIFHPLMRVWIQPGGHVESDENPAQTALREAGEETGLDSVQLIAPHAAPWPGGNPGISSGVILPYWIAEHLIADGDNHLAAPHVHVDHKYLAVASDATPAQTPQHPFQWLSRAELDDLTTIDDVRSCVEALFDHVESSPPALHAGVLD